MIFRSALLRELATSAVAIFLVLLGISITTQLVRLLGQAASGAITSTGVIALLGFTLVGYLPILLSVTLFIAVLMTLTRSYRDSEMVVWFSCGLGLTRWIRPVLTFSLPLVLTIALLSLLLSPWATVPVAAVQDRALPVGHSLQRRPLGVPMENADAPLFTHHRW